MTTQERLKRLEALLEVELLPLTREERIEAACQTFDRIFGTGATDWAKVEEWYREHPDHGNFSS